MAENKILDCVLTSRVRLARNLRKIPFPHMLDERSAIAKTYEPLKEVLNGKFELNFFRMKDIPEVNQKMLMERHVIGKDLLDNRDIGGLALSDDQQISIMINEEDHYREQCILRGLNLEEAWKKLKPIDEMIVNKLDIAFDAKRGFITACPTNLGTAMRASVMVFLPALSISGGMNNVINAVNKLGITVRGSFGEGSKADGYLYQVSNSGSMGVDESDIIKNINDAVTKICNLELQARDNMMQNDSISLKNRIMRSYGVLQNCYSLSYHEFLGLFAWVKLGADMGLLIIHDRRRLNDLIDDCAPNALRVKLNKNLTNEQCDIERADFVGKAIKNLI